MIIPPLMQRRFYNIFPHLEYVSGVVRDTISNFCAGQEFAFIYRPKTLESLAEKIETGRFERWSDLEDLFACTVIIPNLNYEQMVIDFLKTTFVEVELKRRGTTLKAPDVFRFDSTRFIGKLIPQEGNEDSLIYNIKFEVQIRTAFEHAWVVTTHPLTYKSEVVDWRRYRLAAQLKAAAEQMDMLVMGFDQASQFISENTWPDIEAKKVIMERIKNAFSEKQIMKELEPKDWTRFSNNVYNMIAATSESQKMNPTRRYRHVVNGIKTFLEELGKLEPNKVPLSISLVQLIFGILSECAFLKPPLNGYTPIITDELAILYPSVKNFDKYFLFDL